MPSGSPGARVGRLTCQPSSSAAGASPAPGSRAGWSASPGDTVAAMATIESVHISGFRSLADVRIDGLPQVSVLIGANGSGKSNLIRFFELLSWMLKSRRLAEFVARQGGADDQLFRGRRVTPLIDATVSIRTDAGAQSTIRFALVWSQGDRFYFHGRGAAIFRDRAVRLRRTWQRLGSAGTTRRESLRRRRARAVAGGKRDDRTHDLAPACVQLCRLSVSRHLRCLPIHGAVGCRKIVHNSGCVQTAVTSLRFCSVLSAKTCVVTSWVCRQIGRILPVFERFDHGGCSMARYCCAGRPNGERQDRLARI